MEKRKAVVTILGLSEFKAIYSSEVNNIILGEEIYYTNMFELLCENISDEYKIVPFYTKEAHAKQEHFFNKYKSKIVLCDECLVDENNFQNILKYFDNIINKFDNVIIDVTNGLRHIPILITIDMIMQNIKQPDKIENIIFGKMKEDSRLTNKEYSVYQIIDIKEYLELANLSFVVTNFQDNYTISKHIKIKSIKYQTLVDAMNKFSSDMMSLSIENLLDNSAKKLKESITNIINDEDTILINELKVLYTHIDTIFTKKEHRYITYYELAKVLKEKGYLVHTLALIFEAIGFYLKTNFKTYDDSLDKFISQKEKNINSNSELDYYKLIDGCRSFLFYSKVKNSNNFFNKNNINIIYDNLNVENIENFKTFAKKVKKLRNNLLHANSGNMLDNSDTDIDKILNDFEKYCIGSNSILENKKKELIQEPKSNPIKKATTSTLKPIRIVKKALK